MEKLRAVLNALTTDGQRELAALAKTTVNYLRKAICRGQKFDAFICVELAKGSGGRIRCEDLRPDVDWQAVRDGRA
ncbi:MULTISPECIES: YdaS family helix-turn-helix protein [Burkholderia]|uniref:YdaS family helix-turn-helix protein n=1 Tax=Burkholderia TaxID=32008 RepID=UPI00075F50FE|nr:MULTISPECIES: YdaS family helix-turn-helix protein [Burkholderia]KWA10769.1 hypothetical protein WT36_00360 [Burkholderia territorii]OMY27907.1 hypothetical protein AQ842_05750 [Burkholderia pseudomallei]OMY38975.1 hypothetical protein AQ843_00230 [Burkholderia pseudomallei]